VFGNIKTRSVARFYINHTTGLYTNPLTVAISLKQNNYTNLSFSISGNEIMHRIKFFLHTFIYY